MTLPPPQPRTIGLPAMPGGPQRRPWRRLPVVVGIDTLIAAGFWLIQGHSFLVTLLYAQCIGLVSYTFISLGYLWAVPEAESVELRGPRLAAVVVAGCAGGDLLGTMLGNLLRGIPLMPFDPGHPRELAASLVITVLLGLGVSLAARARARAAAQRAALEAVAHQATLARLQLLQSQLEPHMLFNTLANLRALVGSEPEAAQAMLDRLIDFLRATLAGSRAGRHALVDEFARIDDYLALMQVRMGGRLRVTLDLPAALAARPVPALLLQPLVENAIRHGLEPQRGPGELRVSARQNGDALVLDVCDSGLGLEAAAAAPREGPSGGFGLAQVRERLQVLFGDAASLRLDPREGGGTRAEIRLPLPPLPSPVRDPGTPADPARAGSA